MALTTAHKSGCSIKTRPCPFCGSRNVECEDRDGSAFILCKGCGTEIRTPDVPNSRDFIRDRWNTRTYTKTSTLCPVCGLLVGVKDASSTKGAICPNCHHVF